MAAAEIIEGEIFRDARGKIASLNRFSFADVRRVYFITHPDVSVIRGWNGHKLERKWFCCIKGAFTIGLVEIDDWMTPSKALKPGIFHISEEKSEILCVPAGFASCIVAEVPDSTLMVLSDKTFDEAMAVQDSYRFDTDYWFDWSKVK